MAGRPKTLDRNHALGVALEGYWREGLYGMSINEVCRRAKISKPGLYREFGGEDGLLANVLHLYHEIIVRDVVRLLRTPHSFEAVLRIYLRGTITRDGHPPGCLLAEMLLVYPSLGKQTQAAVNVLEAAILAAYREWIHGAQERGEVSSELVIEDAAQHLFTQMNMASVDALRGKDPEMIRRTVTMALWCFAPNLTL